MSKTAILSFQIGAPIVNHRYDTIIILFHEFDEIFSRVGIDNHASYEREREKERERERESKRTYS